MMLEDEAKAWVAGRFDVSRETMARLEAFVSLISSEAGSQNLVSSASFAQVWNRHIADSAQLLEFGAVPRGRWLDLGSGAGFPGLIIAALSPAPVTLVEERALRADFLARAAELLAVDIEILPTRAERVAPRPFATISARAFAPLGRLLEIAAPFSTEKTLWLLPKGRNAQTELDAVRATWQGDFRLEPSRTDPDARIIVATGVSRRGRRSRRP